MSNHQKKILVFADWYEPGYRAGGPIRSVANLVKRLPYHFSIITRNNDHHDENPYSGIEPDQWIERSENERVMYLSPSNRNIKFLKMIMRSEDFDAVYLNSLFSPQFTLAPLRIAKNMRSRPLIVLAPRGMLKSGALSVKSRKKKVFLMLAKALSWFKGITWHATNEMEKEEIQKVFGNSAHVKIAPNLVSIPEKTDGDIQKRSDVLKLVTISRVSKEKGIYKAIQYLKGIKKGECEFHIYGTQQNAHYLDMCKAAAAKLKNVSVHFHGEIQYDEVPKVLRENHFFYSPTLGENYGHAIVESLMSGTPVIISNKTPWKDLEAAQAGWDLKLNNIVFEQVLNHCCQMENEEYQELRSGAFKLGMEIANNKEHLEQNRALFLT